MLYGLVILFSLSSFAYNCTSFWANGFPDRDHMRVENLCDEFLPERPINPKIKIYFTKPSEVTAEQKSRMAAMADALSYAYAKYEGLGRMPDVKAILYHRPHYSDADSLAFSFLNFYNEREACPILFYPLSLSLTKPHFQQLVAHELFHCFQKKNLKEQVNVVLNDREGLWWFEGTAQFFSNAVYPNSDFEYHSYFAPLAPEALLHEQESPYRLGHFFQSYFNNTGMSERRLVDVIRRFPTTATGDEAQVVARIPNIAMTFHKYAEELAAENLRDSSGAVAPLRANKTIQELTTAAHQEISVPYSDFTVQPVQLVFKAGRRYQLTLNLPAPTKVTMKKAEEVNFLPFMTVVTTPCEEDRKYDVVMTSVNPSLTAYTATIAIDSEQSPECACDVNKPPQDQCLAGSWTLDLSTMQAFMRRMMEGIPGTQVGEVSGLYDVTFLATGEAYFKPQELTSYVYLHREDGTTEMKSVMNGHAQTQYSTGQNMICSRSVLNNLNQRMTVTSNGNTQTTDISPPFEIGTYHFTYACEGDTLIYKEALGVGPHGSNITFDYVFRRIGR